MRLVNAVLVRCQHEASASAAIRSANDSASPPSASSPVSFSALAYSMTPSMRVATGTLSSACAAKLPAA